MRNFISELQLLNTVTYTRKAYVLVYISENLFLSTFHSIPIETSTIYFVWKTSVDVRNGGMPTQKARY